MKRCTREFRRKPFIVFYDIKPAVFSTGNRKL